MKYFIFIISILIFFLFLKTIPPTIYLGDSGEIVVAAYTLGIGHPPGYPLYILTGKIFTFIPLADIAFRMNLFATVFVIFTFLLIFLNSKIFIEIISNSERKEIISIISIIIALFYVISETVWFNAINAKGGIYIFTQVLILLAFYSFFIFYKSKKAKFCYLSLYLTGFLVPAHNSALLFTLLLIFLNIYFFRKYTEKLPILKLLFFIIFSFFTSYIYLFIRAKADPVLDWAGINKFQEVFEHIIRKRYWSDNKFSFSVLLFRLNNYFIQFIKNYNILVLFFLFGIYYLFVKNKNIFFVVILFFILNTISLIYGIETSAGFNLSSLATISLYISRGFYLINDLLAIFISAYGLFYIFDLFNKKLNLNIIFLAIIILIIPVIMMFNNYESNNHSQKFLGYDHPMNIMKTLKETDILFSRNDCPSFNILYIKNIQKKFKNLKVYDRDYAVLDISIYEKNSDKKQMRKTEIKFIFNNSDIVYFTDYFEDKENNISSTPYGILFKIFTEKKPINNTQNLLKLYTLRDFFRNKNLDLFYKDFISKYFIAKTEYLIKLGDKEKAYKFIEFIDKLSGKSPATLTEIIRVAFGQLNDINLTIKYLKKMVYLNPYDIKALDILMKIYLQYNFDEGVAWFDEFYKIIPDAKYKEKIKKNIEIFRQSIGKHYQ
ncbi:MAG: DUF2723 domain-containing protein [Candidatus Goldbacteria bacterium]|nr:DUF2723 domain-containing protein [Candidatus Goldiibacteriota bacterium]